MPLCHSALAARAFWAFLYGTAFNQIGDPPEFEEACSLFNIDPDLVQEWAHGFTGWYPGIFDTSDGVIDDPSAIQLTLPNRVDLTLEFHAGDTYWFLGDDHRPSRTVLSNIGPHWKLPGLRWEEAVAMAHRSSESTSDRAVALLLLLPTVWLTKGDSVDSARQVLAQV